MTRLLRVILATAVFAAAGLAQVKWRVLTNSGAPRAYCGHAWDSTRDRLVAFGGLQGISTLVNTTIEWTGSQWQVLSPATSPSARSRVAMAYDAARGVTLLFGGDLGLGGFSNQTWSWNGTTWTQRAPTTVPAGRFGAAMAYDSARQVVVMFGGFVPGGTDNAEVFEWNGTNWTQRTFGGPAPQARGAHRMAYDEARAVCVLHGGYRTPAQSTLADSWSWNGTSWTQLPAGPGSLCDQVFAYDAARRRVVLFGGLNIAGTFLTDLNQTWEWDGIAWTQRTPTAFPSARSSGANAYDPGNGRILLGGGTNAFGIQPTDTLALAPTNPASVSSFGAGCASSAGPIALDASSLPYLGGAFVQRLSGAPINATLGMVIIAKSNATVSGLPLPLDLTVLSAPGCFLNVGLDLLLNIALSGGSGSATLNLPGDPSLVGVPFYSQGAVVDPQSPRPFQIAMSPGRRFVFGAP